MTSLDKQLEQRATKSLSWLRDAIAMQLDRKGLVDTGGAVGSLEVQGNKLLGYSYIYQLDQGRPPGKFPPVDNIVEWVRRKLRVDESKVGGIAYLVGRKIAREGTAIYKDKTKGLELNKLIEEMTERAAKEATDEMVLYIKQFGIGR